MPADELEEIAGAARPRTGHGKYWGFYPTKEADAVLAKVTGSKTAFLNEAVILLAKRKGML